MKLSGIFICAFILCWPMLTHAQLKCSDENAILIWHKTSSYLQSLLEQANSPEPPKFLLYHKRLNLPKISDGNDVLAYYEHRKRQLHVVCSDNDIDVFELTVRHESTHYFLHSIFSRLPFWLEEGLASYMESSFFDGDTLMHSINKDRMTEFIHILKQGKVPLIEDILDDKMNRLTASQQYAVSWALVFALLHNESDETQKKRRGMLIEFLEKFKEIPDSNSMNDDSHTASFLEYINMENADKSEWQNNWHREIWALRGY